MIGPRVTAPKVCVFLHKDGKRVDVEMTSRGLRLMHHPTLAVVVDGAVYDLVDQGGGVSVYRFHYQVVL